MTRPQRRGPGPRRVPIPAVLIVCALGIAAAQDPPAPPNGEIPPPDPATAIRGRLLDPDGRPTSGAEVRVQRQDQLYDRRDWYPVSWVPPTTAGVAEDGRFVAENLVGETFLVRICAPGRAPQTLREVPAGAALTIHLRDGHALAGRVVDDATGKALPNATVVACDPAALLFGVEACPSVEGDEQGRFAFEDLPAGPVQLRAHARGHAVSELVTLVLPLDATAAQPALRLRAGARVAGLVHDGNGRPLAGVRIWSAPTSLDVQVLKAEAEWPIFTADDGLFEIPGIPAGRSYTLRAHRSDRAVARSDPFAAVAGRDVDGIELRMPAPAVLRLRPVDPDERMIDGFHLMLRRTGESGRYTEGLEERWIRREDERFEVRVPEPGRLDLLFLPQGLAELERTDVELRSATVTDLGTIEFERGGTIEGRVTDTSDVPIPRATVQSVWFGGAGPRFREVRTEEDGGYIIGGLGRGRVDVEARARGYTSLRHEALEPGERADFRLEATGSIEGRIELEQGGSPPGFQILLHFEADSSTGTGENIERAFSTEDGVYRIDDLGAATYTVEARAPAHAPGKARGVIVEPGKTAAVDTIVLENGLRLSGTVLSGSDARPLSGVGVEARLDSGPLSGIETTSAEETTSSDEEGRFELNSLGAGSYVLRASHPDYAVTRETVLVDSQVAADELVLRLHGGGRLGGTVRDGEGQPARDRKVLATQGMLEIHDARTATTDAAGAYEIPRLSPGSYQVVLVDGARLETKTAVIRDGDLTIVDFGDKPPIRLRGTVLRAGDPLPGTGLFFSESGMVMNLDALEYTVADSDGHYEIGLERPGIYRVMVGKPGVAGGGSTVEIDVPDDDDVLRDIVLEVDGISGTVFDAEGRPLAGAAVSARRDGALDDGAAAMQVAETDAGGQYSIQGLKAGIYRVTAVAAGHRVGEVHPVALEAADRIGGIDIRLERGETLRGVVLDPLGRGVRGAFVFAAPAGSGGALSATSAETDFNGAFRITIPAEGPIDLTAIGGGRAPAILHGVSPDEDPVTLLMTEGGSLRIRVVGGDGIPHAGAALSVRAIPGFLASDMAQLIGPAPPTDAAGVSVIPHLAPGTYEVRLVGRNDLAPGRVAVREGVETPLLLEFP